MARGGQLTRLARRILPALAAVVLLAAVLLLANDAASGYDRLSAWYPWVLTASVLALLALIVAIGTAPFADCAPNCARACPARG